MPRKSRQASCSGFLHIIVRGIGKQILFEDDSDYLFFLSILKKKSIEVSVKVCAYCLMDNHVHLLLFDQSQNTPLLMKKIGVSYASYYNQKYQRTGHVFQDRYKSEAVDNKVYLLNVFRYILKNPEKAGICSAANYPWSSYKFYGVKNSFVDTEMIADLIGDTVQFRELISENDNDSCMEHYSPRKTDEEARQIMEEMGLKSGTALQSLSKKERNHFIINLLQKGLSIRQIERLTGISRGVIQRIKR